MILEIRASLTRLYDTVTPNRLCKTHAENVAIVQGMIDRGSDRCGRYPRYLQRGIGNRAAQHPGPYYAHPTEEPDK